MMPEKYIGRLFGKKGHRIKTVKQQCSATINISRSASSRRKISIIGTYEEIQEAKIALHDSLLETGVDFRPLIRVKENEDSIYPIEEPVHYREDDGYDREMTSELEHRNIILTNAYKTVPQKIENNWYKSDDHSGYSLGDIDQKNTNVEDDAKLNKHLFETRKELELQTKLVTELRAELKEQSKMSEMSEMFIKRTE